MIVGELLSSPGEESRNMGIEKIDVKNFKSFKDLKSALGRFNALIGADASGKSNFVSIFRFLKDDIASFGLNKSVFLQGVVEHQEI